MTAKKERKNKKPSRICCIYDTETCNIVDEYAGTYVAYPILFILNDVRSISMREYRPDTACEHVSYLRREEEVYDYIADLVEFGRDNDIMPIVAAYNLLFDLLPLLDGLRKRYTISVNAQSGSSIYTLDLLDDNDDQLLRFWDTSYLEPRGLSKMGETAGLDKAAGAWDYDLIRTPETPLTDIELYYAKRDVQVIPAYLRYLLETTEYIDEEDLGTSLITKTSIVRLLGKRVIGEMTTPKGRKLVGLMYADCKKETPRSYEIYGMRKAAFRGGLTFTASTYASEMQHNVASLDVTSMHHAFINGRYVPQNFELLRNPSRLHHIMTNIKECSISDVLSRYYRPFNQAFNAQVRLYRLRIKDGSPFDREGIATLAEAKFYKSAIADFSTPDKELAIADAMSNGYKDRAYNAQSCYGKIIAADIAEIYVNEIEWWILCRVYDFDSFDVLRGEMSSSFALPPDYVTLQSNMLFDQKTECKQLIDAVSCDADWTPRGLLPDAVYDRARRGREELDYLEEYYKVMVKGAFNAIYGSQAQDVNKPSYTISKAGDVIIDDETRKRSDDWDASKQQLVNYIYGSRIVAGSRMHLVIAIELLKRQFGDSVRITGGDTDSIKIATDSSVSNDDLIAALDPLHRAITHAIDTCMYRLRRDHPDHASSLDKIGVFEIEHGGTRYASHIEYWNKTRMSKSEGGKWSITCAGVRRPAGFYNLEDIANRLTEVGYSDEQVADMVLGYNTTYYRSVSFLLGHKQPHPCEIYDADVTDYLGQTHHVHTHRSTCLYPIAKTIGEELVETNAHNIIAKRMQGVDVRRDPVEIWQDPYTIYIKTCGETISIAKKED